MTGLDSRIYSTRRWKEEEKGGEIRSEAQMRATYKLIGDKKKYRFKLSTSFFFKKRQSNKITSVPGR